MPNSRTDLRRPLLAVVLLVSLVFGVVPVTPVAPRAVEAATPTELFISEYIEGSSNNKAIEIFNGTGAPVDLAAGGYNLQQFSNGSTTPSLTLSLTGVVAPGDVYVVAHTSAAPAILAQADQLTGAGLFNGNDALVLRKGTTVIDSLGQVGFDPGTQWGTGDTSTADNTLRRKPNISSGDTDPTDAFDPALEWVGFPTDTFDGLGAHALALFDELIISEYIEGSSNNKAIEIFNGTGAPVDLAAGGYSLRMFFNGNPVSTLSIPLTGVVAHDDVYVVAHSSATAAILDQADQTNGAGWFNGDDAVALFKGDTVVDSIGQAGFDPGTQWGMGDVSTADNTLRRKPNIFAGDTDPTDVFDPALEWDGFPIDTFDGLGFHVYDQDGDAAPEVASVTPADGATGTPLDGNLTIDFSEPVDVAGEWFTIQCTLSGAHTAAASGGPQSFTLDPDTDFAHGDWCTVTIAAGQVTDQDDDDPPDSLAANFAWSFGPGDLCLAAPTTAIYAVQGSGLASPLVGSHVVVEGVAVSDFQAATSLGGFHLQDAAGDGDPATSDGIFVFAPGAVDVAVNDVVRAAGTVAEFFEMTELTAVNRVAVCGAGGPIAPAPITLPVSSLNDFEAFEGMLVTFPQALSVTEHFQLARFGEVAVSVGGRLWQPTHLALPGPEANALQDLNNRSRILIDDASTLQNPAVVPYPDPGLSAENTLRIGDSVTGLTGVLDFGFGLYRVQPVGVVPFVHNNPRPPAPEPVGGSVRISAFNVLNYFNGDGQGGGFPTSRGANNLQELIRQEAKIVSAITGLDADVIGLMEIENDAGPNSAVATLVAALNAATAPGTYAYIDTGVIGTDEIRVAVIYRPAAVTPVGDYAILDSTVDPDFNDAKNRPAVAQTFALNSNGARFTVAVNHLKSKGSDCNDVFDPDVGDGQGNCNLTRLAAARALARWLATDPTGSGDADNIIIGDLNSYAMEDPIRALKDAGYTDLIAAYLGAGAYSYVFDGQSGYLDHALGSPTLTGQVSGVTEWHINADEPLALDYNTDFTNDEQDETFYAPDPYRASDHDPVLVGLEALAYAFGGFQPPIKSLPDSNNAKAGQAVPVKFSLGGDRGLDIFAAGYPAYGAIACGSGELLTIGTPAETPGDSGLTYDAASDTYTFVWQTPSDAAGQCVQLVLLLADGTYHRANFSLK